MRHNSVDLTLEQFKMVIEALEQRLELLMEMRLENQEAKLNRVSRLLDVRSVFRHALDRCEE